MVPNLHYGALRPWMAPSGKIFIPKASTRRLEKRNRQMDFFKILSRTLVLTSFSKSWMGPFVSNSVTKHEYIGRRTVQPSNEGVQTTRIGGIAVWGCAHLIGGVYHPHWGVDKFLFVSRPRLQPVQWAATNLGSTQARLSNRSIRGPVTQSNSIYFR